MLNASPTNNNAAPLDNQPGDFQLDDSLPSPESNRADPPENNSTLKLPVKDSQSAILQVSLPERAKVYVNGQPTSTAGAVRRYVSRHLDDGRRYYYRVVAELDGQRLEQKVELQAGEVTPIKFEFAEQRPRETLVTLRVPENASVTLAGNRSASVNKPGNVRKFTTRMLQPGETWTGYEIEISYQQDGQVVRKSQTLDIEGGKSHVVDFVNDIEKVAVR